MELNEAWRNSLAPNLALYISDFLEIQDMENWAEALVMQITFEPKIRYAEYMHVDLLRNHRLDAYMIRALIESDFKLTFSVMRRLFTHVTSTHSVYLSCGDQNYETEDSDGKVAYFMTEQILRGEIIHPDRFYYI